MREVAEGATDANAALGREDAALRTGAALLDLGYRSILQVTGPARGRFLQGMVSNDVAGLVPGGSCRAALLDARGGVVALLRIVAIGDAILLETDEGRLTVLQATLEHHRVAAPVRFEALPTAVLGVLGPGAVSLLTHLTGIEVQGPLCVDSSIGGHPVRLVPAPDLGPSGVVLHVAREAAAVIGAALVEAGAVAVRRAAWDVVRVELGLPCWGFEVTEGSLLHETGLVEQLCSFTKGCYVGQEIVARLEARGGHVNRALRALRSRHPVTAGGEVSFQAETVGVVTTAGVSPLLGPVAMALVHRKHFAAGTVVTVEGIEATVALLPLDPLTHRGSDL